MTNKMMQGGTMRLGELLREFLRGFVDLARVEVLQNQISQNQEKRINARVCRVGAEGEAYDLEAG